MPRDYGGKERRRFERLSVNFTLVYRVDSPLTVKMQIGWDKEVDALMVDLSRAGMGIVTDYDIPQETVVELRFMLIDLSLGKQERTHTMDIVGEVRSNMRVKAKEYRLGILFNSISEEDQNAIESFIKNNRLFPSA